MRPIALSCSWGVEHPNLVLICLIFCRTMCFRLFNFVLSVWTSIFRHILAAAHRPTKFGAAKARNHLVNGCQLPRKAMSAAATFLAPSSPLILVLPAVALVCRPTGTYLLPQRPSGLERPHISPGRTWPTSGWLLINIH